MAKLEEIKLMVEHVKFKNVEGVLYLMSERIAWMSKLKNANNISHFYEDIKSKKISSDKKTKIKLKIILYNDKSSIFDFTNPFGLTKQVEERDKASELLAIFLNDFKDRRRKELEEKEKFLIANPNIAHLYNDLILDGISSTEDFWENLVDLHAFRNDSKNQRTGKSTHDIMDNDPFAGLFIKNEFKFKNSKISNYPTIFVDSHRELLKEDGFGLNEFWSSISPSSNKNLMNRFNYWSMSFLGSMKDDSKKNYELLGKKLELNEEIRDLKKQEVSNFKYVKLNL